MVCDFFNYAMCGWLGEKLFSFGRPFPIRTRQMFNKLIVQEDAFYFRPGYGKWMSGRTNRFFPIKRNLIGHK